MKLSAKPDFERATEMWNHYWAREILKRPLLKAQITRKGRSPVNVGEKAYYHAVTRKYAQQLKRVDQWLDRTIFLGEAIPYFSPDHGPDQFATFFGAELKFAKDSPGTNWVEPIVDDWEKALPLRFDANGSTWKSLLEYSRMIKNHAQGRYLVGACDLHSNADTLSALRSPERLCMDFYDCPELVEEAMGAVRRAYRPVYDGLYQAGGMSRATGSIGWIGFWCEGKFASIQCDFICMVSPEIANRYILPALEEEANFLDHCVYHLDGPQALPHLDSLLAIKKLDVVQWVPGAGQPPQCEWLEVLKKCQKAGKGLDLYGDVEMVKKMSRALCPEGVVYTVSVASEKDFDELARWLEKHT